MPSPIRFAEIRRLLEAAGWQLVRISGSHHLFDRPGGPVVSVPVHNGKVKAGYAKRIQKIIAAHQEREAQPGDQAGEGQGAGEGK